MQRVARPEWARIVLDILSKKDRDSTWLAKKIGMHQSQMSRLINGDPRYHLSPEIKGRIAEALEVPESLVFSDVEGTG